MSHTIKEIFSQFYETTYEIYKTINEINLNMENNDPELIEKLVELITLRGKIISSINVNSFDDIQWDIEEKNQINQLKKWELTFIPKLNEFYLSFSEQIDKLQQGKKTAQYYNESFDLNIDGVYFDKRK